jgi:hypothetical protein
LGPFCQARLLRINHLRRENIRWCPRIREVGLSLRALEVELRFDPYRMERIEVYYRGKACGLARRVDLHLNSQRGGSQHYDR